MYKFRGYSTFYKKMIYGTSLLQTPSPYIFSENDLTKMKAVDAPSVSKCYILNDPKHTEVYQGDVVRYTFIQLKETYNKYYLIKENNTQPYAEEVWRDYDINHETFEVSRFHNVKYSGECVNLEYFTGHNTCNVIGNIFENPDIIKGDVISDETT